jgi:hypothetical protein
MPIHRTAVVDAARLDASRAVEGTDDDVILIPLCQPSLLSRCSSDVSQFGCGSDQCAAGASGGECIAG